MKRARRQAITVCCGGRFFFLHRCLRTAEPHSAIKSYIWRKRLIKQAFCGVLSRVMRKYNSVTYEVGKAKAEQAAGMFGLTAGQRAASCPSRVAKPLAKPLTGGWRSATYARSQQSAPCFSRSICSSDFMLM